MKNNVSSSNICTCSTVSHKSDPNLSISSFLGNSFSPMMVRDASLRYQNSINNPEESFVDDFDDLDETFNRHVYTPKASNVECEGHFSINDRPVKVNIFMVRNFLH